MIRLFVYGTLKAGYRAHGLLKRWNPTALGEAVTHPRFQLKDQGGFPGMVDNVEGRTTGVKGELYEVENEKDCLASLDVYEGVSHGLFRRGEVELADGTKALAYFYNRPCDNEPVIESGTW